MNGRALVFVALAALALVLSPIGWTCPVRAAFAVPCPSCGMTRATLLALSGQFDAAFAMHPLVFVIVPLALAFFAVETVGYLRSGAWDATARFRPRALVVSVAAALLFVVWVARFFGAFGGPAPV